MKKLLTLTTFSFIFIFLQGQPSDSEFPKGKWVFYIEAAQGMTTNFKINADLYAATLRLTPHAVLIPGKLRIGPAIAAAYNNKKTDGLLGANVALKLKTLKLGQLGSLLNIQLQAEHLWGTRSQQLAGGGLKVEIGQLLLLGISGHRDYHLNNWWWQVCVGYNLLRKKNNQTDDPLQ